MTQEQSHKLIIANIFLLFACVILLVGCTSPIGYTSAPLQTYDRDTEYRIDESEKDFSVVIFYSRYQFIPETVSVAIACKSAITNLALKYAQSKNRKIKPITDQEIQISFGRNGLTGITSCSAKLQVDYETKETP